MDAADDAERGYYVYVHKDKATGIPFYVGKGKGNRAFDIMGRHRLWREKIQSLKDGYEAEIVSADLSEEEAYDLERDLIEKHGRLSDGTGTLVNITTGGSLDFGEGSITVFRVELPPEIAAKEQEKYDKATYRKLKPDEKNSIALEIVEQMRLFQDEYDKLTEAKKADLTDCEFFLDTYIWQILLTADKLGRRRIAYKDFCYELESDLAQMDFESDCYTAETESTSTLGLFDRLRAYLRQKVGFLKAGHNLSR